MNGSIKVNGEARDWKDQSMVELLGEFDVGPERTGVAVALNGAVLPRGDWAATRLAHGDEVEIVYIVRGG